MKQILSRKELLWGLAHEEERVFFPTFCYWMEQWLTDPCLPPFDAYSIDDWKKDEDLVLAVSFDKITENAPLALIEVLRTKSGIDKNKVLLLLEFTSVNSILKVKIALAALINVKKYWKNENENPVQFKKDLLKRIGDHIDMTRDYYLLAAQLDICPELFEILNANKINVALYCVEKTVKAMVDAINRLLVQIPQMPDDNQKDELKTRVKSYYKWLLDLRRLAPSYFTEISKELDTLSCYQDYKVEGLANLIDLKAETYLRDQRLDWDKYREYLISTACRYSYAWKMEILNILWEKKLGTETDENLRLALHTLTNNDKKPTYAGCQAFLKKYLERYPEKLGDVTHAVDLLIKSSFTRMQIYTLIAIHDGDFTACHWQELPIALQKMWFWLLELGLQRPNWCYHLSLLEWWVKNPEQEKLFNKLVAKSLKSPWELDAEVLYKGFGRVRQVVSCHKDLIYQEVGCFCERILREVVIDDKLWDEIASVENYCQLNLEQAFQAQIKLREKKAKQNERQEARKIKDEAKIQAFLSKLV